MKKLQLVCVFVLLSATLMAQLAKQADSLAKALITLKEDTNKVITLNLLSKALYANNPDKAIATAKDAIVLAHRLGFIDGEARATCNTGIALYYKGDYKQAIAMQEQAIALWESIKNESGVADAYNNLGINQDEQGHYAQALTYYLKALKIHEEKHNDSRIGSICNNIGGVYENLKDNDKALVYFKRSLALEEKINNQRVVATTLANIGDVYNDEGNNDLAIEYLQKSLAIRIQLQDNNGISTCYNNIGSAYMEIREYSKAADYFAKALAIRRNTGDKYGISTTLLNMGGLYAYMGGLHPSAVSYKNQETPNDGAIKNLVYIRKAITYYIEGADLAAQIGSLDFLKDAYQDLAKLYNASGDCEKAYDYYKKYSAIKDSVFNVEGSKQIAEMSAKYDTEKKDVEIKLLNKESEVQTTRQRYITIVLIVVLALSSLLLWAFKNKQKTNALLAVKNQEIELQNKHITDSITYAKRIQQAILPSIELIFQALEQSFIFYKPKDVVSGDFYAFFEREGSIILAAVDCTGHGVPGAFMSVIGHNLLTEIIVERGISKPSKILEHLNKEVRKALKQDKNDTRDGMDVAIISLDMANKRVQYAGANRPLYIVTSNQLPVNDEQGVLTTDNQQLTTVLATKAPIGGHTDVHQVFDNHEMQMQQGDTLYLTSDGYADQFGGPKGKKFMTKQLKETLIGIQNLDMQAQEAALSEAFATWKGEHEQVDDVLVIGVKMI